MGREREEAAKQGSQTKRRGTRDDSSRRQCQPKRQLLAAREREREREALISAV